MDRVGEDGGLQAGFGRTNDVQAFGDDSSSVSKGAVGTRRASLKEDRRKPAGLCVGFVDGLDTNAVPSRGPTNKRCQAAELRKQGIHFDSVPTASTS